MALVHAGRECDSPEFRLQALLGRQRKSRWIGRSLHLKHLTIVVIKMATMEGSLSKWTNVMKGWQYRWFVLDDNAGLLSYYTVSTCQSFFKICIVCGLRYNRVRDVMSVVVKL
jgi:hypothetical protein